MNRQNHLMMWDQQRMRHGITLRLVEQLPESRLTSHPIAGMRTPVELIVHFYMSAQMFTDSVLKGTLGDYDEKAIVAGITTKEKLLAFVKQAWATADGNARAVTDAQLAAVVTTPWGDFPGIAMIGILYDEYLHHRGQLYAYLRTLGVEPVMMWDFDHNADEFKPREHAKS